jgi:MtrB/PioB family decaheme-associated outer membrane protein
MKICNEIMKVSALSLAVRGALIAMFVLPMMAQAAESLEDEVAAIRHPTNFIELGAESVSQGSSKFGEYNGLDKSGGRAVGNFSVRGGDAYDGGDGTRRWSLTGSDLGTSSRSLGGTVGNQGSWNVGVGFDELRHNLSNSYITPYNGGVGGNVFAMPTGFGLISTTANGLNPTGTDALNAAQRAALHQLNLYSTRKNSSLNVGVNLNEQWKVKFDFNHLEQTGGKLKGFGSMGIGSVTGEVVAMLPSPTQYKTDTMNLALNWVGEKGHINTSYSSSIFRDAYDSVSFQTFQGASSMQIMSVAPSNVFQQLNLGAGYAFSPKTKLIAGYSISRNTQNEAFVADSVSMAVAAPRTSLNGKVINTHYDLKLIDQTTKDLAVSAGVKYDQRDNRTESNFYQLNALDGGANHVGIFPNTPYSIEKTLWELAGDYRLNRDQHLRVAFTTEDTARSCRQYAVSTTVAAGASGYYPAGTNCVVATNSKDDKLGATYKLKAGEDVNLNFGYSYSKRKTDSDPTAITARIVTNGNASLAPGVTPLIWGQNAGDFRGFYPFFNASRKEQMLKAGVNWQAAEKLAVGLGGKFTDDKYDSTYGVTAGSSWNLNLDATYGYSDDGSVSTYLTQQHRQRDMTDLQKSPTSAVTNAGQATQNSASATAIGVPPGATWTDKLKDDNTTIGVGVKQSGLMHSKLELAGDLTYSLGKSAYGTQLNYATTTSTGGFTCASPQILSCGDLPVIQNKTLQLKLSGNYQLDQSSRIALGYLVQQLKSNDYYYNGLQLGSSPNGMMPTNQQPGSYTVFVVSASYIYNFK